MKIKAPLEVEPLDKGQMLALYQEIGEGEMNGRKFTLLRSMVGMHFAFQETVDGEIVTHTVALMPVIEAALAAIVESSPVG